MRFDEVLMVLAFTFISLSFVLPAFSQFEGSFLSNTPLNASILQPICVQISENLSTGIFFTNLTGSIQNKQYPISNMKVWNNATWNYVGGSGGTEYWVSYCSGNTINMTVYQAVCGDLSDGQGHYMLVAFDNTAGNEKGLGFVNGTSTSPGNNPQYGPSGPNQYFLIADEVGPGGNAPVYLRFWLNPEPDNLPSGNYTTTYIIKAVEVGTSPGDVNC